MSYQYRAGLKSGTYFQVPLCAFAFGSSDKERLDALISFGVMEAGEKWWLRASEDQRQERLQRWMKIKPTADFKSSYKRHCYAARGGEITDVNIGSANGCLQRYDILKRFTQNFMEKNGADPMVRLKTSFIFEARDGKGISPRDLSVLAAIYSIIGNKQGPVLIRQASIRCRALGYKSAAVREREFPTRKDGQLPLTDWQLRSLLDKLTSADFMHESLTVVV